MRLVRVIRVENTVITGGNLKFIRRIGTPIAEEPNQAPGSMAPAAAALLTLSEHEACKF
jgi:hypothetical protein